MLSDKIEPKGKEVGFQDIEDNMGDDIDDTADHTHIS
jgi:hypothetical protein